MVAELSGQWQVAHPEPNKRAQVARMMLAAWRVSPERQLARVVPEWHMPE
jgi:hypothetical protein